MSPDRDCGTENTINLFRQHDGDQAVLTFAYTSRVTLVRYATIPQHKKHQPAALQGIINSRYSRQCRPLLRPRRRPSAQAHTSGSTRFRARPSTVFPTTAKRAKKKQPIAKSPPAKTQDAKKKRQRRRQES